MQPRESRFWLRFETGTRSGETVPLPQGVATLGRKPENQVVVPDASVSGKHAELHVAEGEAVLHDLGSTNGTRVGGERVGERRLAHGDRIAIGNVHLLFLDHALDGAAAPEPEALPGGGAAAGTAGEAVGRVGEEELVRGGRRSRAGLLLVVAALLAAALLAWRTLRVRARTAREVTPVTLVPGNRLADPSFEEDGWEAAEGAPQAFAAGDAFARSGESGLGVELAAGEWAFASSPPFPIGPRESLALSGWLSAEDGAAGRLGVELSSSRGDAPTWIVWARAQDATGGFVQCTLPLGLVPGYDQGRVVVAASVPAEASGGGRVALDDLALVPGGKAPSGASFQEFEARTFGGDAATAAVVRSGRFVLPGIDFGAWGPEGISGRGGASWKAESTPKGLVLRAMDVLPGSVLHLRFDTALAGSGSAGGAGTDDRGGDGWIATIGAKGYHAQATQFEDEAASDLLVGRGLDLLRVGFDRPVHLAGSVSEGALRVRAEAEGLAGFDLQVTFTEERAKATILAQKATGESAADPGAALADWNELLDRYPFDSAVIHRAEEARAKLEQQGLDEVAAVRKELARARFFQLPDLYQSCKRRLVDTARRYGESDVATEAQHTIQEIDGDLAALDGGEGGGDLARVQAVLGALDPKSSPQLAQHVREYLEQHRGQGDQD